MKPSKTTAGLLALITGIFGFHRFYLSQYCRGAAYILFPSLLALLIAWISGTLDLFRHTETDMHFGLLNRMFFTPIIFYVPVLVLAVVEAVLFFVMKQEKFDQRHAGKKHGIGTRLGISLGSIAVCGLILMLIFNKFYAEASVNVRDSEAAFTFTAAELCAEFASNEDQAYEDYNMVVIGVSGTISEDFTDIATDARTLILEGESELNVKCNFLADEQAKVKDLVIGQPISIRGYCLQKLNDEVILNDCLLLEAGALPEPDPVQPLDTLNTVIE